MWFCLPFIRHGWGRFLSRDMAGRAGLHSRLNSGMAGTNQKIARHSNLLLWAGLDYGRLTTESPRGRGG